MSGILDTVDEKTNLVGENRLELLLFSLHGTQTYGINVFKVREVLQCPPLTMIPKRNPMIRGLAHIRGGTIPVIDLNAAIGNGLTENIEHSFIIITEYNLSVQGFLVNSVERILNLNWQSIKQPPIGLGKESYLTAVTEIEGDIIEILDVEKILNEIDPHNLVETSPGTVSDEMLTEIKSHNLKILLAEDSQVARNAVERCVTQMGIDVVLTHNGKEALDHLVSLAKSGVEPSEEYFLMISDIEMPEMDGYTLTTEIRQNAALEDLYIILHTSMSGCFNQAMVDKAGANKFLAKFQPDGLSNLILDHLEEVFHIIDKAA